MKRIFSKIAVSIVLISALTILIGGTVSAQSAVTNHQKTVTTTLNSCPPTIQQGSQGAAVVTLQNALHELYRDFDDPSYYFNSPHNFHPPISVDGIFGPLTRAAVLDFQYWNPPLAQDGIVGPMTWHVLHKC